MITRFAPSPTGPLHLGHAYSAILAHDTAKAAGGKFLLRIEDIDTARSKPEWEAQIYEDLEWLGLSWDVPCMRQSSRAAAYQSAIDRLENMGLLYACTCTRKDIAAAISAPQEGADAGFDGFPYPGTCRNKSVSAPNAALRLDMRKATEAIENVEYIEVSRGVEEICRTSGEQLVNRDGDIVIARKDIGTSYHLAVVVDDDAQCITHVVRGGDLAPATPIHVLLQKLLEFQTPKYIHHRLIRDETGKRLAKRDDARSIQSFRAAGATPDDIREMVGLNAK